MAVSRDVEYGSWRKVVTNSSIAALRMTDPRDREPHQLTERDGRSVPPWEHELKYVVSRLSLEAVRCHLDSLCLSDRSYPVNTVTSVYFDTPDFRSVREKFNGDYLKTKFRIRWYEQSGNFSRAFAEVKHRSGARRRKFRFDAEHEGRELSRRHLDDPRMLELPMVFRHHGIRLPEPLLPVLVLSYRRRRWLEPSSGSRISLDTHIRVDRAHPLILSAERDVRLDHAVLEVKGEHNELPGPLCHLATIGCVRESVSKYGVCFQRISGGIA